MILHGYLQQTLILRLEQSIFGGINEDGRLKPILGSKMKAGLKAKAQIT